MENLPTFYNTSEILRLMRCSRSTIYNQLRTNPDFPRPAKFGRNLLWPVASFNAWLSKRYGVAA